MARKQRHGWVYSKKGEHVLEENTTDQTAEDKIKEMEARVKTEVSLKVEGRLLENVLRRTELELEEEAEGS